MKLKQLFLATLFCALISSCGHQTITNHPNDVRSKWEGTFDSKYNTDGKIISWILYDEGTMTGKWETENGSTSINLEGVYQIHGDTISFHGKGGLLIKNKVTTQVRISGKGELLLTKAKGTFKIEIANPIYPFDSGTWEVNQI